MRFDIPEQKKLVHQMRIPIRWGDMDAMGHVNNTTYFRYFEIARLDWIFEVTGHAALADDRAEIGDVTVIVGRIQCHGAIVDEHAGRDRGQLERDVSGTGPRRADHEGEPERDRQRDGQSRGRGSISVTRVTG